MLMPLKNSKLYWAKIQDPAPSSFWDLSNFSPAIFVSKYSIKKKSPDTNVTSWFWFA